MKRQINEIKLINFIAILVLGLIALGSRALWNQCIEAGGCEDGLVNNIFRPAYFTSISLIVFFTVFLFLPTRYLVSWLKYYFSWLFPVGALIVASNISTGGGVFPIFARETIIMCSIFAGIVTSLFIAYKFYSERKS